MTTPYAMRTYYFVPDLVDAITSNFLNVLAQAVDSQALRDTGFIPLFRVVPGRRAPYIVEIEDQRHVRLYDDAGNMFVYHDLHNTAPPVNFEQAQQQKTALALGVAFCIYLTHPEITFEAPAKFSKAAQKQHERKIQSKSPDWTVVGFTYDRRQRTYNIDGCTVSSHTRRYGKKLITVKSHVRKFTRLKQQA